MKIPAVLAPLLLAAFATAQGDSITLTTGETVDKATIQSFTVRELKYSKGGSQKTVPSDQVAGIDLEKFRDVYRRGLADRDPDILLTTARDQIKAKSPLLAQLGFVEAARLFYAAGRGADGGGALEEMIKEVPDGGLAPEFYRLKFENYMGRGGDGYGNALIVANKMVNDATTQAWPQGLVLEGDFFVALAERAKGGDAKVFQEKMRQISGRALGPNPQLAGRADVQLAHSLREAGDKDAAGKIYEGILDKESSDVNSRAGSYLGMGLLAMSRGDAANREPFREALLYFLRVRLETKGAWDSLQAEAMYNGLLAAEKWGGEDWRVAGFRCKQVLLNDFKDTEWAARARAK